MFETLNICTNGVYQALSSPLPSPPPPREPGQEAKVINILIHITWQQSTLRPTIYRKPGNHIHRRCTTSICVKHVTHQTQSQACYYIWTTGSIYSITS